MPPVVVGKDKLAIVVDNKLSVILLNSSNLMYQHYFINVPIASSTPIFNLIQDGSYYVLYTDLSINQYYLLSISNYNTDGLIINPALVPFFVMNQTQLTPLFDNYIKPTSISTIYKVNCLTGTVSDVQIPNATITIYSCNQKTKICFV
jgi:hypothetical protein